MGNITLKCTDSITGEHLAYEVSLPCCTSYYCLPDPVCESRSLGSRPLIQSNTAQHLKKEKFQHMVTCSIRVYWFICYSDHSTNGFQPIKQQLYCIRLQIIFVIYDNFDAVVLPINILNNFNDNIDQ